MADIKQLKDAIATLEKAGDIDSIRAALALIGEPVTPSVANTGSSFFEIGKSYFIRTVTLYQVGRVVAVSGQFVKLEDASWIADTGRFADALKSGDFAEIEPVGESYVNLGSIIDFFPFEHKLPKGQK
jgi:hypothetical protein